MTPTELRERATEAGELYYEILKEIRKGRVEVEVERISRVGRGLLDTYKLKLKNRLFDAESVIFRDVDTEEEFDSEVVQVKEYDPDRRVLVVCLKKKDFTLANKQPNQVVLISDLRFLVTRWVDFMKEHGARLGLPTKLPQLTMPDLPSQATEEQRSAVTQLLEHPFSYVWGAPGTGKTRFVLSQVIVAYLRAGKRVGIFAPTNLSLEQVLTGVMEVTDEAGIDRDVILRLGNPTHSFAEQYPEVCELQGTERLHRGVQRQIKVLDGIRKRTVVVVYPGHRRQWMRTRSRQMALLLVPVPLLLKSNNGYKKKKKKKNRRYAQLCNSCIPTIGIKNVRTTVRIQSMVNGCL